MKPAFIFTLMFCVASCSSAEPAKKPAPAPIEAEPAFEVQPDEGPLLTRSVTAYSYSQKPAIETDAEEVFVKDDHTYVVVPLNGLMSDLCSVKEQHGFVVPYEGGNTQRQGPADRSMIVRLVGDAPESFTLNHWTFEEVSNSSTSYREGLGFQEVKVGLKNAKKNKTLPASFLKGAATRFRNGYTGGSTQGFYQYAHDHMKSLSGISGKPATRVPQRKRGSELGRITKLYTGYASAQESLQNDRPLLTRDGAEENSIQIEDVPGVALAVHPWDAMIKELGKQPVVEPMAASIPHDMLYVHMHDLRDFVKIAHDLDSWVTPVVQAMESSAGPHHFTDRYEKQLVVERTGLAESLGHVAADGVALTLGDPFVREGTDVSLVFKVANQTLLNTALTGFEAKLKGTRKDVSVSDVHIAGSKVRFLSTPDGAARQYRLQLGDLLILSNSPAAIAKFIAVNQKKAPSIADQKDFQYMRTIYPFSKEEETGFIFVSDAFVAHTISPRVKIAEDRRQKAQQDLYTLNYSALLFGMLEGRTPTSPEEAAGDSAYLKHGDGSAIQFSAESGAFSQYGSVGFMAPLSEWQIDRVSKEEADAYQRFARSYESYWSGYIDPIAVQIKRSADGLRLEADVRMLPLIDNSEYNDLGRLVGQQRIQAPVPNQGAVWAFGVGKNASLRRDLDKSVTMFTGGSGISIGWLGDWVMVGAADRSGSWDGALLAQLIPESPARTRATIGPDEGAVVGRLPLYAGVHIGNQLMFAGVLTAARAYLDQAAPGLIEWGKSEPYRDVDIVTVKEKDSSSMTMGMQLHYAIVKDVWLLSLDRGTLEMQINAILDGLAPKSVSGTSPLPANDDLQSSLGLQFSNSNELTWLAKTLLGLMEDYALKNSYQAASAYTMLRQGLSRDLTPDEARTMGLAYLGYEPSSIHGGSFSFSPLGSVEHSLYGGPMKRMLPAIPVQGSSLTETFNRLRKLQAAVGFSGEGNHRGLHAHIVWEQK